MYNLCEIYNNRACCYFKTFWFLCLLLISLHITFDPRGSWPNIEALGLVVSKKKTFFMHTLTNLYKIADTPRPQGMAVLATGPLFGHN